MEMTFALLLAVVCFMVGITAGYAMCTASFKAYAKAEDSIKRHTRELELINLQLLCLRLAIDHNIPLHATLHIITQAYDPDTAAEVYRRLQKG